jgi:hypothetical protein
MFQSTTTSAKAVAEKSSPAAEFSARAHKAVTSADLVFDR